MSVATMPPEAVTAHSGAPPHRPAASTTARRRPRPRFGPVGDGRHPITTSSPVRLTARGRALLRVAAVAAIAVMGFGLAQAVAPSSPTVTAVRTVTVAPGQTAWDLARGINPGVDPRVTLTEIKQLNGLASAGLIQPGQELAVPVFATGS